MRLLRRLAGSPTAALAALAGFREHALQKLAGVAARCLDDVFRCAPGHDLAAAVAALGPEGGDGGGEIVAWGTPEDVVKAPRSYTGKFLESVLTKAGKRRKSGGGGASEAAE